MGLEGITTKGTPSRRDFLKQGMALLASGIVVPTTAIETLASGGRTVFYENELPAATERDFYYYDITDEAVIEKLSVPYFAKIELFKNLQLMQVYEITQRSGNRPSAIGTMDYSDTTFNQSPIPFGLVKEKGNILLYDIVRNEPDKKKLEVVEDNDGNTAERELDYVFGSHARDKFERLHSIEGRKRFVDVTTPKTFYSAKLGDEFRIKDRGAEDAGVPEKIDEQFFLANNIYQLVYDSAAQVRRDW